MESLNVSNMMSSLLEAPDVGAEGGVSFAGKSLSLNTAEDAGPLLEAVRAYPAGGMRLLDLSGNSLGVEAAGALGAQLARRPELRTARWADLFTGRMKTEIPEALSALGKGMMLAQTQLVILDLSDNAFGPIGIKGLVELLKSPVCMFLQELRLNNNGIGITGTEHLVKALQPPPARLQVLEMGRNRLENAGAKAMSTIIQRLPELRVLRMPQNGIYHPGVAALAAALGACPLLEQLDLNDNTVGPRGAAPLAAALARLPRLRRLDLGDCLLRSAGAAPVLDAIKLLTQLEEVNLSHDELGPRCVPALEALLAGPGRARLLLAGNALRAPGRQRLAAYGGRAQLREDGEGEEDDDEEAEEEEEEASGSDSGASSGSDDDGEDASPAAEDNDADVSDIVSSSVKTPVTSFLLNPSGDNFRALGNGVDQLLQDHIKACPDEVSGLEAGCALLLGLCGLREVVHSSTLARFLVSRADGAGSRWLLANTLLTNLGLIKSEKKCHMRWDRESCVETLAPFVTEGWFPADLRDTLQFFIKLHMDNPEKSKSLDFSRFPQLYRKT